MRTWLLILLVISMASLARADEVLLKDGTHLQGKVVLDDEVLRFVVTGTTTPRAFPASQVQTLRHSPGEVDTLLLVDGTEFTGTAMLARNRIVKFTVLSLGISGDRDLPEQSISILVIDNRGIDEAVPNPDTPAPGTRKPSAPPPTPPMPPWSMLGITEIPTQRIAIEVEGIINCKIDPWQLEKIEGLGFSLREAEEAREQLRMEGRRAGTNRDHIDMQLECINGWISTLKTEMNQAKTRSRRGMTILRAWDGTNQRWIQVECRKNVHRRVLRSLEPGDMYSLFCDPVPHAFRIIVTEETYNLDTKLTDEIFDDITSRTIGGTVNRSGTPSEPRKRSKAISRRWKPTAHDPLAPPRFVDFGSSYVSCEIVSIEKMSEQPAAWSPPTGPMPWTERALAEGEPGGLEIKPVVSETGRSYNAFLPQDKSMAGRLLVHVYRKNPDGSRGDRLTPIGGHEVEVAMGSHAEFVQNRSKPAPGPYEIDIEAVTWCPRDDLKRD